MSELETTLAILHLDNRHIAENASFGDFDKRSFIDLNTVLYIIFIIFKLIQELRSIVLLVLNDKEMAKGTLKKWLKLIKRLGSDYTVPTFSLFVNV